MEEADRQGTDIDLSEGNGAVEDPFADVPPDPLAEEGLPPGVSAGSLPGENPSEAEDGGEPIVEPEEGEFLPDPEAETEGEDLEDPAPEEPATGVEGSPAHEAEHEAEAEEAKAEPEEKKKETRRKSRRSRKKKESSPAGASPIRGYVILMKGEAEGSWVEAFERPGPDRDRPFVVQQRNSTAALRKAYRLLSENEDEPQEFLLVSVPEKLWSPKLVAGRVHRQTAISVES